MDKAKGVVKSGWHPSGKDGKKESWRGDFKGINQVAGWVGKGKNPQQAAQEHQSRPIATLKDPNAFGPPPKNVNYHGGAAVPNAITPDRRGLGAPLSAEEIYAQNKSKQRSREDAAQKPIPPPVPYRADTAGLSNENLPKPPVRRIDATSTPSIPQPNSQPARPHTKPKPSLPPRLPPRELATPTEESPPSYTSATKGQGALNGFGHGALSRLGSAGISVPGLNIGGQPEARSPNQDETDYRAASSNSTEKPTFSELHSRFSGLSTASQPLERSSGGGTSLAQKQAALKTASSLRNDPTSVSLSDARASAATANNFRDRHGEQVADGLRGAQAFNSRYNVAGKLGDYTDGLPGKEEQPSPSTLSSPIEASSTKKVAPPPPPKRGLFTKAAHANSPPPIPLSSKPHS